MMERAILAHWESSPVGEENVAGSLYRNFGGDYGVFFDAYNCWLYKSQSHILRALDQFDWKGKRVLSAWGRALTRSNSSAAVLFGQELISYLQRSG
jgi:hypothetical protein